MDDKDKFFSSIFLNFFKPFIFSHGNNHSEHYLDKEIDDSSDNTLSKSPRDTLLKSSEEDATGCTIRRDDSLYLPGNNLFDPNDSGNGNAFFYDFSPSFHDGEFNSLFNFMNKMFEQSEGFSHGFFKENFALPNFPAIPSNPMSPLLPDSGPQHGYEDPQEDKRDRDLDDSSGKEIASLLKKAHPDGFNSTPSATHSHFHSTSIVRIRRPDGVIEETRKYRDNNGREEVQVTTHQPDPSDNIQSQDQLMPGTFSSILKNFQFRIF